MKETSNKGYEQGYVYLPYKLEFTVPKIVEGTFSPKLLLHNRYSNVEVNGMFYETIGEKKSKGKQIFSDIDPYGEENWDD